MDCLDKVEVDIAAVLGTRELPISTLLGLGRGAQLRLGGGGPETVAILANGHEIGCGRLVKGRDDMLALDVRKLFRRLAAAPRPEPGVET